jgi:hypothetical protein
MARQAVQLGRVNVKDLRPIVARRGSPSRWRGMSPPGQPVSTTAATTGLRSRDWENCVLSGSASVTIKVQKMIPDIVRKLEALLNKGVTAEAEVVYLMSGLRKLLEQQQAKKQYKYLTFHCDWTLHSKLEDPAAQQVLIKFDAANPHLKAGVELHQLPSELRNEIDNISQMKYFKK